MLVKQSKKEAGLGLNIMFALLTCSCFGFVPWLKSYHLNHFILLTTIVHILPPWIIH